MRPGPWMDEWTPRLRHFRFVPMAGGHANDFDTLQAILRIESSAEERRILEQLRTALMPPPGPTPPSSLLEFRTCGVELRILVERRRLRLVIENGFDDMNPAQFRGAIEIEERLAGFGLPFE